jgi:hypothetical protein
MGALMLSTLVVPWGIDDSPTVKIEPPRPVRPSERAAAPAVTVDTSTRVEFAWDLLDDAPVAAWVLLIGAWVIGAASIATSLATRGLAMAFARAGAGLLGVVLLIVAVAAIPRPVSGMPGRPLLALLTFVLAVAAAVAAHCRLRLGGRVAPAVQASVGGLAAVLSLVSLIVSLVDMGSLTRYTPWQVVLLAIVSITVSLVLLAGLVMLCAGGFKASSHFTKVGLGLVYGSFAAMALTLLVVMPLMARSEWLSALLVMFNGLNIVAPPIVLLAAGSAAAITLLVLRARAGAPRHQPAAPQAAPAHAVVAAAGEQGADAVAARLAHLDKLLSAGAITPQEHAANRARILAEL